MVIYGVQIHDERLRCTKLETFVYSNKENAIYFLDRNNFKFSHDNGCYTNFINQYDNDLKASIIKMEVL